MAGITWWNFYFKLFPGAIKAPQIIEFLQHLMRHLRRPLLVIWDGLPGHRSAAGPRLRRRPGQATHPGVAAGLCTRVESGRTYLELSQATRIAQLLSPRTGQLSSMACAALRRMRRRPTLVAAFWKQAELF